MDAGEKAFIDRFVADYCRPHRAVLADRLAAFVASRQMALLSSENTDFALAAGVRNASAPSPVAPGEEVRFSFASEGTDRESDAWRAELRVPPNATSETMLVLTVKNAANRPEEGLFSIAGCALPVSSGSAEIPFGLFLAGIQNTDVALRRPDGQPVAGRLLFF